MPLTQYSIFPPGCIIPPEPPDRLGLAGFTADPSTGLLRIPVNPRPCSLIAFQDSVPFPSETIPALAEALCQTSRKLGAEAIYADLEHPPEKEAISLLETLLRQTEHLLLPEAYAKTGGEPVVLWQPSHGSFSAFLEHKTQTYPGPLWLEYAPVCLRLYITEAGTSAECITPPALAQWLGETAATIHTNDDLVCHYASRKTGQGVEALLWDTETDYRKKVLLAEQAGLTGILTLYPEVAALQERPA